MQVSVARPSSKDIKNSKLYVTNLPDHFSQDQVVEVFEQVCARGCVRDLYAGVHFFLISGVDVPTGLRSTGENDVIR